MKCLQLNETEKNNARYSTSEKVNHTSEKLTEAEKNARAGKHNCAAKSFLKALIGA